MSSSARYAEVVLPVPVSRAYTYQIPDALRDRVVPGARVVVPVRRGAVVGIVTAVSDRPSAVSDIKSVSAAPDEQPALSPALLQLGHWMSDYYGAPLGLALRAILPGPLWSVARPAGPSEAAERVLALTQRVESLLERERVFKRAPKRRAAYEAVEALGGSAPIRHLTDQLKLSDTVINGLVTQGLARIDRHTETRDPFAALSSPPPPALTADQQRVVAAIQNLPADTPALIHGVTGSGKTLVYLDLLRGVVASGQGAILLVPEIALTPQTVARVRGVFGDQVAVLHSGLSDGERADAWRALRRGERRVAVGPRSAVFAPVQRLGAIVVDEEHDPSYKQGTAPRYHARDAAVERARLEGGARLILGSATPSLETLDHAARGRVATLTLPERVGARPLPPVEVIDLKTAPRVVEAGAIPWTEALDGAVSAALARGEQTILLLNRRGFATFVQCPACGNVPGCPQCAIALTVHQTPAAMRCHYCGHEESVPEICAICGHATQRLRGLGTQQLEHFVAARFPAARIARMDLDTTSTKWSHHHILERVARGEVDILLGTQMIAKGLDFPNVTVVGVVDADTGLHFPDFRAAERTFQLVAQVAGRAGRGPKGGRVYVQTRSPDHHAIRAAAAHSMDAFAEAELPHRTPPNPPYPPSVGLVRFVVSGREQARTAAIAARVAAWLRRAGTERLAGALTVLGPAPCPITRLRGLWRWHVLVKAAEARALGRVVRAWRAKSHRAVTVDRDPVSLL
ncbi:MAG TPA: primosomal protein N' [Gemmatimonadales bacterium]|jgi:primosomal protein N' (replication factor Y)|nr:primosomal protein N' [Gemmatimonadales bacterium]